MKNILITGGAGFIGSHLVRLLVNKYPEYHIVNIDLLTYAGNLENLKDIENKDNYTFVRCDICNRDKVSQIFKNFVGLRSFSNSSGNDSGITCTLVESLPLFFNTPAVKLLGTITPCILLQAWIQAGLQKFVSTAAVTPKFLFAKEVSHSSGN